MCVSLHSSCSQHFVAFNISWVTLQTHAETHLVFMQGPLVLIKFNKNWDVPTNICSIRRREYPFSGFYATAYIQMAKKTDFREMTLEPSVVNTLRYTHWVQVCLQIIPILCISLRSVVKFTHQQLYPDGKEPPQYPSNRRLGGPWSQSECFGVKKRYSSPARVWNPEPSSLNPTWENNFIVVPKIWKNHSKDLISDDKTCLCEVEDLSWALNDAVIVFNDGNIELQFCPWSWMGVKLGHWHWGRNVGWGCLRIGCWGEYLGLRGTR
jgi:hypothetical protein